MPAAASPTDQARALHAAGRAADAASLLASAGDRGDIDALMQHAVWRLTGDLGERDVPLARTLLTRAATLGHVDAALMEVALTANGSGAPADFAAARRLLEKAAMSDPVAQNQLRRLCAMALDRSGRPIETSQARIVSTSPDLRHFPELLTGEECLHLAQVSAPRLEPAQVVDPGTGRLLPHPVRTSDTAVIGPAQEDLVTRAINLRIAAASGTDVAAGEPLTILRYGPGQQYRPHHDAIAGVANQRAWTMLVWLNDGYAGGETRFSPSGLTVKGRRGDGLLFRNLLPDGRPDPAAQHAGLPVSAGHKWMATRWIRQAPLDLWGA